MTGVGSDLLRIQEIQIYIFGDSFTGQSLNAEVGVDKVGFFFQMGL